MSLNLLITRQLVSNSWLITDITSHVSEPRGMASEDKCHTTHMMGATSWYPWGLSLGIHIASSLHLSPEMHMAWS